MAISSKGYKPYNFESHNSLKLSFTNIRDLRSNFIDYECFLESNSSEILALCLFSVIVDFKWLWMESLHKNIHLMLELAFSSKLVQDSYIISIAKTASKKIGPLIRSMTFLSPALYLFKSTIRPCMQYCCHVQASAPWFLFGTVR